MPVCTQTDSCCMPLGYPPPRVTIDSIVSRINHHILPRLGNVSLNELTGRHIVQFSLDVLETPPKRGRQKTIERLSLSELDPDDLRKRKKTLYALIGVLRLAVQLAWENSETDSERSWRCIHRVPLAEIPEPFFLREKNVRRFWNVAALWQALFPLKPI